MESVALEEDHAVAANAANTGEKSSSSRMLYCREEVGSVNSLVEMTVTHRYASAADAHAAKRQEQALPQQALPEASSMERSRRRSLPGVLSESREVPATSREGACLSASSSSSSACSSSASSRPWGGAPAAAETEDNRDSQEACGPIEEGKQQADMKKGKTPLTRTMLLIITFTALTGLLMGYDLCVVGVVLSEIQKHFHLCGSNFSCGAKSLFVAILAPGAALGSALGGLLSDTLGRRCGLVLSDLLLLLGSLILGVGEAFWLMLLGRLVLGLGVGTGFVVYATYTSEISPASRRGQLVACQEVAQCFGCLLAYAMAAIFGEHTWRYLLGLAGVVAGVQILGEYWIIPESPRFAILHGDEERARASLKRIGYHDAAEIDRIIQELKEDCAGASSIRAPGTIIRSQKPAGTVILGDAAAACGNNNAGATTEVKQGGSGNSSHKQHQSLLTSERQSHSCDSCGCPPGCCSSCLEVCSSDRRTWRRRCSGRTSLQRRRSSSSSGSSSSSSEPDSAGATNALPPPPPNAPLPHSNCARRGSSVGSSQSLRCCSSRPAATSMNWKTTNDTDNAEIAEDTLRGARTSRKKSTWCWAYGKWKHKLQLLKQHRKALFIAVGCAVAQNFTAANSVIYFSIDIFHLAGVRNPLHAGVGVGLVKFLGVLACLALVDRAGRRLLLLVGSTGTLICHLLMLTGFVMQGKIGVDLHGAAGAAATPPTGAQASSPAATWLLVISLLIYIFCWNCSWAALMFVVASEVLPTALRGLGMGLTIMTFWLLSFIMQYSLEPLFTLISIPGTFGLLAFLNAFSLLFVVLMVPEGKGRSLEEIHRHRAAAASCASPQRKSAFLIPPPPPLPVQLPAFVSRATKSLCGRSHAYRGRRCRRGGGGGSRSNSGNNLSSNCAIVRRRGGGSTSSSTCSASVMKKRLTSCHSQSSPVMLQHSSAGAVVVEVVGGRRYVTTRYPSEDTCTTSDTYHMPHMLTRTAAATSTSDGAVESASTDAGISYNTQIAPVAVPPPPALLASSGSSSISAPWSAYNKDDQHVRHTTGGGGTTEEMATTAAAIAIAIACSPHNDKKHLQQLFTTSRADSDQQAIAYHVTTLEGGSSSSTNPPPIVNLRDCKIMGSDAATTTTTTTTTPTTARMNTTNATTAATTANTTSSSTTIASSPPTTVL